MPNKIRSQTIWLPTGTPDTTNIAAADMESGGGQLGQLGQEFDWNDRVYQRVKFDSGAGALGGGGATTAGMAAYWKDKDTYLVTNDSRFAVGGQSANGYRNFVAGVIRLAAATPGNYIDILKKGDNIPLKDGGNTFAIGETVIAEGDTTAAAFDRVAVGTASTYSPVGIARGTASGGLVNVDVDIPDTP